MRHQQRGRGYRKAATCRGVEEPAEPAAGGDGGSERMETLEPALSSGGGNHRFAGAGCSGGVSAPVTSDPNPTGSAVNPVAVNPMRMRIGTDEVRAVDPNPAALPGPVAGVPDVVWRGRCDDHFGLRGRRRLADHLAGRCSHHRRIFNVNHPAFNTARDECKNCCAQHGDEAQLSHHLCLDGGHWRFVHIAAEGANKFKDRKMVGGKMPFNYLATASKSRSTGVSVSCGKVKSWPSAPGSSPTCCLAMRT